MDTPSIAVVGSAEPNRTYEPALANIAQAKQAAENIGAALAAAGYRIIVYAAFIESDVVRGFVNSGKAATKSIIVQYATGQKGPEPFPNTEVTATYSNLTKMTAKIGRSLITARWDRPTALFSSPEANQL